MLEQKAGGSRRKNQRDDDMMSDEEVMALRDSEAEESEMDENDLYGDGEEHDDDDEDAEGWGRSRANYYGADEAEDAEDLKREEEEATRLQKKHLAEMSAADYFEEDDVEEWRRTAREADLAGGDVNVVQEELPEQDPSLLSAKERLALLKSSYPEVMPLAEEVAKAQKTLAELKKQDTKVAKVQFSALSIYAGTINAYFALFVSGMDKGRVDLKDHPVMEGILKAKELWRSAQELAGDGDEAAESGSTSEYESAVEELETATTTERPTRKRAARDADIGESDEEDVLSDGESLGESQDDDDDAEDEQDEFAVPLPKVDAAAAAQRKKSRRAAGDFDEEAVDEVEKQESRNRKKTLRFYTSKIDQASNKIQNRLTGDEDVPYKERLFERQQRLMEEARRRGLKSSGADEADNFSDGDDGEDAKAITESFADDYYNEVKAKSAGKKAQRREAHETAVRAAKEGRLAEAAEQLGTDGKRAINYQILKNRGLSKKSNKDNRNPRLKKRKKYDKATKKLASTRAVYKAPTTSYGGEQTGIKKNLSRSVHFSG